MKVVGKIPPLLIYLSVVQNIGESKKMTDNIIINSIDYSGSIVDGPGIRTVIYFQGCNKKCKGCHNFSTWNIKQGKEMLISKLIDVLKNNVTNKKITISGGEPLLQYESLLKLVKKLKDFDIVLYTGYELNEIPKEILKYLTYIKVGEYIESKRSTTIPYIGSTNQKFIKLK